MAKERQQRLDETIDFIVSRVPANEQTSVRTFLGQEFVTTLTPTERDVELDRMSLGSAGEKTERAMRRSAMLMAIVVEGPVSRAPALKTMTFQRLAIEFAELVYRVRLIVDMKSNTVQLLRSIFETKLRPEPLVFLTKNVLMVQGATTNNGEDNVVSFNFHYEPSQNRFLIQHGAKAGDCPGAYEFRAISIPAVDWKQVKSRGTTQNSGSFAGLIGTKLANETVMVTTQFTGCAFCLKRHNGQLYAAHVSPSDMPQVGADRGPTVLTQQLLGQNPNVTAGNFSNAASTNDPFRVYGAGFSNLPGLSQGYPLVMPGQIKYMTIIAFYQGGQWAFYSQKNVDHKVDSVVSFRYS